MASHLCTGKLQRVGDSALRDDASRFLNADHACLQHCHDAAQRTAQQDGRAFRLEVASVGMGVMVLIKGALLKRRRTGLRDLFIVLRRVGRHPNGADNLPVRHDGHTPAH